MLHIGLLVLLFCLGNVAANFPSEPMVTGITNSTSGDLNTTAVAGCQAVFASPAKGVSCAVNGTIGQNGVVPINMW